MKYFLKPGKSPLNEHPAIICGWDNTPRFGSNGYVLHNFTPELFRQHVHEGLEIVSHKPDEFRILFLKSWNEWAEGNTIEPDQRYGRAYLKALSDELFSKPIQTSEGDINNDHQSV